MLRFVCLACVFVAFSAHAQLSMQPVITSSGTTHYVATPTYFEFGFYFIAKEETIAKSIDSVASSVRQFEKALEEDELVPSVLSKTGPSLRDIHSTAVTTYIRLRFDSRIIPDDKDRLGSFGAFCDEIAALGERFKATASGPIFGVDDLEVHERSAVQQATENALYRAEAIAELMNSSIFEVEEVKVDSVEWNAESKDATLRPTIDQVVCEAHVTVTYRHQP